MLFSTHLYQISLRHIKIARRTLSTLPFDLYPTLSETRTPSTALFLHGILGSKRNWRAPALAFRKLHPHFQCVTVDLRGHGQSQQQTLINHNTIMQCVDDISQVINAPTLGIPVVNNTAVPDLLCGHSFGGKVALAYISKLHAEDESLPLNTWIIDSLPGAYHRNSFAENGDFESVFKVFEVLATLPTSYTTREEMVDSLCTTHGFEKSLALWLATNLTLDIPTQQFIWSFDLMVIKSLFEDFCALDMWEFLETYDGTGKLHFLRAGRNQAWTPEVFVNVYIFLLFYS